MGNVNSVTARPATDWRSAAHQPRGQPGFAATLHLAKSRWAGAVAGHTDTTPVDATKGAQEHSTQSPTAPSACLLWGSSSPCSHRPTGSLAASSALCFQAAVPGRAGTWGSCTAPGLSQERAAAGKMEAPRPAARLLAVHQSPAFGFCFWHYVFCCPLHDATAGAGRSLPSDAGTSQPSSSTGFLPHPHPKYWHMSS